MYYTTFHPLKHQGKACMEYSKFIFLKEKSIGLNIHEGEWLT
jgi:hypothetical protein